MEHSAGQDEREEPREVETFENLDAGKVGKLLL
jgi:hypothetical protein